MRALELNQNREKAIHSAYVSVKEEPLSRGWRALDSTVQMSSCGSHILNKFTKDEMQIVWKTCAGI